MISIEVSGSDILVRTIDVIVCFSKLALPKKFIYFPFKIGNSTQSSPKNNNLVVFSVVYLGVFLFPVFHA